MDVLQEERRAHRTKSELEQRKQAEASLITGKVLKERPEVKANARAHREFRRVYPLLASIGKNDAMYEAIINRYCMLQAECAEITEIKAEFRASQEDLRQEYAEDTGFTAAEYYKLLESMQKNILALDRQLQSKQKMMFDIEKECAMTISAAARTVPKAAAQKENPLMEALRGSD